MTHRQEGIGSGEEAIPCPRGRSKIFRVEGGARPSTEQLEVGVWPEGRVVWAWHSVSPSVKRLGPHPYLLPLGHSTLVTAPQILCSWP